MRIAVEYADLAVVDLSKIGTPEGHAELANIVRDAMRTQGFFYVVNHGWTPEQVRTPRRMYGTVRSSEFYNVDKPHLRHRGRTLQPGLGRREEDVCRAHARDRVVSGVQAAPILGAPTPLIHHVLY